MHTHTNCSSSKCVDALTNIHKLSAWALDTVDEYPSVREMRVHVHL